MKNKLHYVLLFFTCLLFNSCLELGSGVVSWNEITNDLEPEGRYHQLENSGIKVFIPLEFEQKSVVEFQKVITKNYPPDAARTEIDRINTLQEVTGDFSLFYDDMTHASITVNSLDFMPLTKQDAKYLLGLLRQQLEENLNGAPVTIEKIASQYEGDQSNYIFKYVYKFTNSEEGYEIFNNAYFITKDNKTVFINLNAGFNAHYDPFALKTLI